MNAPVALTINLAEKKAKLHAKMAIGETVDVYLESVAGFTAADIRLSLIRQGVECAFCNSFIVSGARFKDELSLNTNEMIEPFLNADGRDTIGFNLVVVDVENDSLLVNVNVEVMNNPAAKTLVTPPTPVPEGSGFQIQFSEDDENWHDEQTEDDAYWRWRFPNGEWGVGIALIPGEDGEDGADGTNAVLGVWKGEWAGAGTEYDENDAVEHNGSAYISLADENEDNEPGEVGSEAWWSLAVSKGDKGENGEKGEDGEKGEKGDQGTPGDMTNPMTTAGDTIYGGVSGAPTRLAAGTEGQYKRQGATNPAWVDAGNMLSTTIEDDADLSLAHITKGLLLVNKATAVTLTVKAQTDVAFADRSLVVVENMGAGDLVIQAAAGVDINEETAGSITLAKNQSGYLRRHAENDWRMPNYDAEAAP